MNIKMGEKPSMVFIFGKFATLLPKPTCETKIHFNVNLLIIDEGTFQIYSAIKHWSMS